MSQEGNGTITSTDSNLMNDSLAVEDDRIGDVSIEINDQQEPPQYRKRSSSLKEVVIDSPNTTKENIVIDIPDSPQGEKAEPSFTKGNETENEPPSSPQKPSSRPQSPFSNEKATGVPTPERSSSRPPSANTLLLETNQQVRSESPASREKRTSQEKRTSRHSSAERLLKGETGSSRPSSKEKRRSRPTSAENILSTSTENPGSSENLEAPSSRPSSREKKTSRPSTAERLKQQMEDNRPASRPLSKEQLMPESGDIFSEVVIAEKLANSLSSEHKSSRPSSADRPDSSEKQSRPSSSDGIRPSSAEKRSSRPSTPEKKTSRPTSADKRSSRPSSAQPLELSSVPENQPIQKFDDASMIAAVDPEKYDKLESERMQETEAVFERPSSRERKKKKSSRTSRSSTSSLDRAVSPTERKNSASKRSSKQDDQPVEEKGTKDVELPYPDPVERKKRESIPVLAEEEELPWAMYNKMKTRTEEEKEDEDELNEEDSDDDSKYVPVTNDDLPDMYETLQGLDNDDIELNMKTSPPSILNNNQQVEYHQEVQDLKQGLAEEEIKVYLDEFEQRVEQEILMIGNISLDDVQDEERRLREEHITFQQEQARVQRQRQQEIMQAMERAKKYVMSKYKEKYRELRMREEHLMQKDRSYKDEIHRAFRRSESQLRKALKRRKAEVKTMYGDLTFADGQYGGSKGRRWKIDWNRAPQPIQIKLKCLRGVKDKLPGSRYVLMVSLYNRLGGNVMKWSNLKGQQWGGATLPIHHDGEFFNIEMKLDQSVFTVCPSKPDMLPGMVLVFELFILRGSVTPTDKVVGWGCFPICDAEFNVIEGKYKTPMLRGDMDPGIDNFQTIEKLMATDLEHWLCNFYFEIIKLPRYMAGQKEYEVELQFTSGLLSSPDRTKTVEENIDGEKAIFGSRSDMQSPNGLSRLSLKSNSISSSHSKMGEHHSDVKERPNVLIVDDATAGSSGSGTSIRKSSLIHGSQVQMFRAETLSADLRKRKNSSLPGGGHGNEDEQLMVRPMTSVAASRKLVEERGLQLSDDDDDANSSGTDYDDQDIYALKKTDHFKPVKGQPGMFYKVHHNTPSDVYAKKVYTMMPKTPLLTKQKVKKKLTHLEELNTHGFTVKTPWSTKGRIDHKGSRKMQYMARMLLTELGISQIKSRQFWAMILMILVTFWIRMYLHYVGQWVTLIAFEIPINTFNFLPYTVNLNYQNTLLRTREELALIVIGPFTVIFFFAVMVAIAAFIRFLFERFPSILSRFIMAFGIQCVLDPIFIAIIDSALKRYENNGGTESIGDAFKLYWHFDRFYNNDNVTLFVSIALTVFLYFVTTFCAGALLYVYFLKIHNNGRLMDVYWRLHGKEHDFFIPYDLEISNEEMNYICRKAEQWRGEEGERKKTAVYDYIWEEEEMADEIWDDPTSGHGRKTGAKETTTHISIHTLHLDGLRELYRHFLKLPDGAIVEVFGEMNIPGIDEGVKQALIKRTTFQTMNNNNDKNSSNSNIRKRHLSAAGSSLLSLRKNESNEVDESDGLTQKQSAGEYLLGIPSASSQV